LTPRPLSIPSIEPPTEERGQRWRVVESMSAVAMSWVCAVLPSLPFWLFYGSFRRVLRRRRHEAASTLQPEGAATHYASVYGDSAGNEQTPKAIAFFDESYSLSAYLFPLFAITAATLVWMIPCLVRVGAPVGLSKEAASIVASAPGAALSAAAGALARGYLDALSCRRVDALTPMSLHPIWVQLLAAPVVSALLGTFLKAPLDLVVAFGIGALPTTVLMEFVAGRARKALAVDLQQVPAEPPTLHLVQGMTRDMLERLHGEGIGSAAQLAAADPVRLILLIGDRKRVLDLIDQALLITYVGEKIATVRSTGIRGVVELMELVDEQGADVPEFRRERARRLVTEIAAKLGESVDALQNLLRTTYIDPQVELLWKLWGGTFDNDGLEYPDVTADGTEEGAVSERPSASSPQRTRRTSTPSSHR
jgi:hypothetical protein